MRIKVKLFGPEAETVGQHTVVAVLPDRPTCAGLRRQLEADQPRLAPRLPSCRFAVNHEFVEDDHPLSENDEVALIGLVSGG